MNQKTTQIIIAVIVIIVAFFGFKYFFVGAPASDESLVAENNTEFADGQSILILLNKLKEVQLNDTVFSNKTFISLESSERPLDPQVFERKNPFFPIGVEGSGAIISRSTSTASSTSRTR